MKEFKMKLLLNMLKIRYFEEAVRKLHGAGTLFLGDQLYTGEEAVAVGACAALEKSDYITSTHRGHGHVIAKGGDVRYIMAELCGKKTGYNHGKGGSMHIAAPELRIMGACGIVGGGIPVATGTAFASQYQENGRVTIAFFGDAAISQGAFHESLYIASFMKLPCIYLCEYNLYGVSTRQQDVRNIENITDIVCSYGIPGMSVDGNDVEAVYDAVGRAVENARSGAGPTFIECKTYRYYGHFCGEPNTYRPEEEIELWRRPDHDPIERYKKKLLTEEICTAEEIEDIILQAEKMIEEAVEFAQNSPLPEVESVLDDVYCD